MTEEQLKKLHNLSRAIEHESAFLAEPSESLEFCGFDGLADKLMELAVVLNCRGREIRACAKDIVYTEFTQARESSYRGILGICENLSSKKENDDGTETR